MTKLPVYFACILLSILLSPVTSFADDYMSGRAYQYIEQFKDIAQREMQRSGIPASIKLAQGIHESGAGTGSLAKNANNHFGIKCKSYWQGPTYYIEDDDFRNGKLIKSCFRAYEQPGSSYQDHTDFLVGNPRYATLFQLARNDYKGWAKGLKRCGYATDARYAEKIIRIIEKYQLYQYDSQEVKLENDKNQAFALLLEMEGMNVAEESAAVSYAQPQQSQIQAVMPAEIQNNFLDADNTPAVAEQIVAETEVSTPSNTIASNSSALPPAMMLPEDYQRNSRDENTNIITENTEEYHPQSNIQQEPGAAITGQEADFVPASDRFIPREAALPAPTYHIPTSRTKGEDQQVSAGSYSRR